jgi:hypothetical protein
MLFMLLSLVADRIDISFVIALNLRDLLVHER